MNSGKGCLIGCLGMLAAVGAVVSGIVALLFAGGLALSLGFAEDNDADSNCSERDKSHPTVWVCGDGDEDRRKPINKQ